MHKLGTVFVFEGPDGVGKTTLVSAVHEMLETVGQPAVVVSFPGHVPGTLGRHIYDLHHRSAEHNVVALTADGLQMLHVAAHVDTIQSIIRPHVENGGVVLLDRYWWSTWVYGRLSGVQISSLKKMVEVEQSYWLDFRPPVVFLVNRASAKIDVNLRSELHRRKREYDILAGQNLESCQVVRIENSGNVDTAAKAILQIICRVLEVPLGRDESGSPRKKPGPQRQTVSSEALKLPFENVQQVKEDCEPPTANKSALVWSRLDPAKPTIVFDTYWRFAAERQAIFFRRFRRCERPWTEDPILSEYKFTNAYRASDRVSQYLIRDVIYSGDQSQREIFFRVILFKFFNRIDTWKRLVGVFGELTTKRFNVDQYDKELTAAVESGERVYSGAYIMPTGGTRWREDRKHRMHLQLLEYMLSQQVPERIAGSRSMQAAFEVLKSLPTIGDFLAYQYVTDLNYSRLTDFGENEFVVAGPGAKDGIHKCFSTLGGLTEADLIRFVYDHQEEQFRLRSLPFESLWGRQLQLIDCQNLFCEVDKYSRVYHPDIKGTSGRARIKQRFRPASVPLEYWYPPKWGLNERIVSVPSGETEVGSAVEGRQSGAHYQ